MNLQDKDLFLSHSKSPTYSKLLQKTKENIHSIFTKFKNPSISVSGGKDSLVMLDLCLKEKKDCRVWHWDYGIYMPRSIENEVQDIFKNHFNLKFPQLTINFRISKNRDNITGYRAFFQSLFEYTLNQKIDLCCIGLRAEESCKRRVRTKHILEYDRYNDLFNFFPLRYWRYDDVWAYIIKNKIPYPISYDIRNQIQDWSKIRFVTFFDPEFNHLGSIAQDKFLFWKFFKN